MTTETTLQCKKCDYSCKLILQHDNNECVMFLPHICPYRIVIPDWNKELNNPFNFDPYV